MSTVEVNGTTAPGYEPVRDTFATTLAAEPGNGAQLAAYVDGRQVVDLWGGPGLVEESLLPVYSSTKGAAHLIVAMLVQDGTLDLDREVRDYWPEFAAEGKDGITLRQLISHRAGLIGTDAGLSAEQLRDDRAMAEALAAQRPFWCPGSAHGYHALTIGALTGEVVRRATGLTMQEFYAKHLRDTRDLDLFMGLPEAQRPRVVDILAPRLTAGQQAEAEEGRTAADGFTGIAFGQNGGGGADIELHTWGNSPAVQALGQASAGGVGSARGLARMYAAAISTVDGAEPLLTPATQAAVAQIHSAGYDLVVRGDSFFGLGFQHLTQTAPALSSAAFGHSGAAGSLAFADPRSALAFGYTRRLFGRLGGAGPETAVLAKSVRHCAIRAA
jgi:CubicO group peptidase (beta-lactamase class C family)